MKKKIVFITGILALAAILLLLYYGHFWNKVDTGVIALSGNVEVTEADAGFKTAGRVIELLTDEGRLVRNNEKMAVLDSTELESQALQSKAALSEAEARLAELRSGSRPQEIAQAAANVKAAEAEMLKAQKDFQRAERLMKNEAIAPSQFDAARSSYDSRVEQVKAAAEQLSLLKEGPRKEVIRAAEDRVMQARASLRASEERYRYAVLYAPFSGVVLKKNIEIGEVVQAGTPIFTVGDLEDPWVKVYVKEESLPLVKLGQRAAVTVDGYRGKTYEGTVSFISSQAEFTPKTVQTQEERVKLVFGVKVRVKNVNQELKPGMPADVKIFIR